MNSEAAKRQIDQMCRFIEEEAKEKAMEIEAKTDQEFNVERLKLIQQAKEKLRAEYTKKAKQVEIERKIARSTAITKSRLQKMEAREQAIMAALQECQERIVARVSADKNAYKSLLRDLVVQGLIRMLETKVSIQCRQEDLSLVKEVLPDARNKYKQIMKTETGKDYDTEILIDEVKWLPPGPNPAMPGISCMGGVIIKALGGRIVINNTLDQRLSICYEELKPDIRRLMFPLLR